MSIESIDVRAVLRDIEESGGVVLRGFRSHVQLRDSMQQAIDAGKKCAFAPSLKTLREFLNTSGFVAVMADVRVELRNCKVIVEAGAYDSFHVFAVAPDSSA